MKEKRENNIENQSITTLLLSVKSDKVLKSMYFGLSYVVSQDGDGNMTVYFPRRIGKYDFF